MSIPSSHWNEQPEAWIGFARVEPRAGNKTLGSAAGAVVPVLALAFNQDSFVASAVTVLNACEFDVIEIEDIEPFARKAKKYDAANAILNLAASLTGENPVAFGTFQSYTEE